MKKIIKLTLLFCLPINIFNYSLGNENFFNKGLKLYNDKKYEDARFMFERSLVFNPKDSNSYLYLAKIYQTEENEKEFEKNLNTTLLLTPDSEEAMYMLIDVSLEKSDFDQVKELKDKFVKICNTLCSKIDSIEDRLKDMEAKNES